MNSINTINDERVRAKEVLKEAESKEMYLTVVIKSKTKKPEIDFNTKKEAFEFAESLLRQMSLGASKVTVSGFKQLWLHLNFERMKVNI